MVVTANNLIANVESAIATGHEVSGDVLENLSNLADLLSSTGSAIGASVAGHIGDLLNSINNGGSKKAIADRGLFDGVQSYINSLVNSANDLIATVENAVATGHQVSLSVLATLRQLAKLLANTGSAIGASVAEHINTLLANINNGQSRKLSLSEAIQTIQQQVTVLLVQAHALAQELISSIDLPTMIQNAINACLPQNVAQMVIAHMQLNNKGLGEWFGQVGQAAQAFAQEVAQIAGAIVAAGTHAFAGVQQAASVALNQFQAALEAEYNTFVAAISGKN